MLIAADASQLEWRTAVQLSGDVVGLEEIQNKLDTHSLNKQAFQLPTRLISKRYLFRTIFRGSGWAFANDNDFSHVSSSASYWDGINEKFYSKYKGLDSWHHDLAKIVSSGEVIHGPLGRSWSINMARDRFGNLKLPWTIFTNYPVQGTGADVMTIVRVSFYKKIKQKGIPCSFITTVHDSIVVDAESKYLDVIAETFYEAFAEAISNIKKLFGYTWRVPLECEVKYGPNMGEMKKYLTNK